ncbi:MAG: MBL fold metallo-hydrolase [Burkholderiales bacterium]
MKTLQLIAATVLAFSATAHAQQNFAAAQINATELGRGTFMLEGVGGNITLAAGRDGAILVDGQFAPMHEKIKAAVLALTGVPVKVLINTHYHGDHVGGNAPFAGDGVTTIAHENVGKRLAAGTTNPFTGNKAAPVAKEAIPKRPYTKDFSLNVGGRVAKIGHPANAHTDGDSYVYFADANVLATGDIVTLGRYPLVDYANGGSINGLIAALDTYIKIANDKTKVVPGHGPVSDRNTLVSYRNVLASARDRVAKLIAEGKTVQQAVDAKPFPDLDKQTGANQQQSDVFVRGIYQSLKI